MHHLNLTMSPRERIYVRSNHDAANPNPRVFCILNVGDRAIDYLESTLAKEAGILGSIRDYLHLPKAFKATSAQFAI
jgi:hypothetical protein